jgi:hypothetical protein
MPLFLHFSTMSTSPFELSARTPFIFDSFTSAIFVCVFTIFLLVFSIRLQGKAFMVRSIKLCLVDNQRSSGVMVDNQVVSIQSQDRQCRVSTNRHIYLPLGRSGHHLSFGLIVCLKRISCTRLFKRVVCVL